MKFNVFVLTISLMMTSTIALGSGGSGFGGYETVSEYDLGKKVFQKKLYCDSCPLSSIELSPESAISILPELSVDGEYGKLLTSRERRQVTHFLKRRFNI